MSIGERFAAAMFIWACAFAAPLPVQGICALALFLLPVVLKSWRPVDAKARRLVRRFLATFILLSCAIFLLNTFVFRMGGQLVSLGPVAADTAGIQFSLRVLTRLFLLSGSVLLFATSTHLTIMTEAFDESRIPRELSSVFLLAIHYLESIPGRIHAIITAQEARGAAVRGTILARTRTLLAILSPLIVSSLVETVERSHSFELRGFTFRQPPSSTTGVVRPTRWSTLTLLLLTATVCVLVWGIFR